MDYSYWLALSNAEYLSYREKFILVEKFNSIAYSVDSENIYIYSLNTRQVLEIVQRAKNMGVSISWVNE